MRGKWFSRGGRLILVGIMGFCLGPGASAVYSAEKAGGVVALRGQVTVLHEGAGAREALRFKDDVFWKDEINTARQSGAKLLILRRSLLTLREESRVVLIEADFRDPARGRSVLEMATGKIRALIQRGALGPGGVFEIRTPNAVAAVRGTDVVVNIVSPRLTQIVVVSGRAIVRNLLRVAEVLVNPKQMTEVVEDRDPTPPVQVSDGFIKDLVKDLEIGELAVKGDQPPAPVKTWMIQQAAALLPPLLLPRDYKTPEEYNDSLRQIVREIVEGISDTGGGGVAPPSPPEGSVDQLLPGPPPGAPPLPSPPPDQFIPGPPPGVPPLP